MSDRRFKPINAATWRLTDAEKTADVTVVNWQYEPGNVLRYGTNTTPGTTDMTAAIQAAIDVAEAEDRGRVFIPTGTYKTTSTLTVSDDIQIIGEGPKASIITSTVSGVILDCTLADPDTGGTDYGGFRLSNFQIKGDETNTTKGVYVRGAAYGSSIDHMFIHDTTTTHLELIDCWTLGVYSCRLQNQIVAMSSSSAGSIYIDTGHNVTIDDCTINILGNSGYGVKISGGDSPTIVNTAIENCGTMIIADNVNSLTVRDCYFEQRDWSGSGGDNYAVDNDSRDEISIGNTTVCYNIEIKGNHFTCGNRHKIVALHNAIGGEIKNNKVDNSLVNPSYIHIPTPANAYNIEVANNRRIFIFKSYTEANLKNYYSSLSATDRETFLVPVDAFTIATGTPAIGDFSNGRAWAFDDSSTEEITAVVPWPSHWGAGAELHVTAELIISAAGTSGNAVMGCACVAFDADGTTTPTFTYYDSTQAIPTVAGAFELLRDGYFQAPSTYRWTRPIANSDMLIALGVRRVGGNASDTATGDVYVHGVRLVREPSNYEW